MSREVFGRLPDGRAVERLAIGAGALSARVLTLGAGLSDLRFEGAPLTLGSEALADYLGPLRYAGTVVGPVANRISGACARIDGRRFGFAANEGTATLHSGPEGTHGQLWQVLDHGPDALSLGLTLADGLGGFPGRRRLAARFAIAAPAALTLTLTAETDAPTLINLANHSFWHLDGQEGAQTLASPAAHYLPTDARKIPTGEIAPAAGTRFDFRTPRPVGGRGYDHCLCLSRARGPLALAATLAGGGLEMRMETTEPGLQVYDGNPAGVALEAQGWPDAPNRPAFPSVLLRPGDRYRQVTRWSFRPARTGSA